VLQSVGADELLQSISLLITYERKRKDTNAPVTCKRADILKLKLEDYKKAVDIVTAGFEQAGKFLFQQKIFSNRDLPYSTQLVPLATVLAILGEKAESDAIRSKLVRWYWCGVFGELYGSAIETRFARDVVEILDWVSDGPEPSTTSDSTFTPNRLETLRTRNSAAYKGLYALLMRDGCLDFRTGIPIEVQSYFDDSIDVHHIFPRAWCQKNAIDANSYDCIINKTPLSYRTNRIVGGNAPSVYLRSLREKGNIDERRQQEILSSHVIDWNAMMSDNFTAFFNARRESLLQRIENATGKVIPRTAVDSNSISSAEDVELNADEDEP
jgi:hypothetical protein